MIVAKTNDMDKSDKGDLASNEQGALSYLVLGWSGVFARSHLAKM